MFPSKNQTCLLHLIKMRQRYLKLLRYLKYLINTCNIIISDSRRQLNVVIIKKFRFLKNIFVFLLFSICQSADSYLQLFLHSYKRNKKRSCSNLKRLLEITVIKEKKNKKRRKEKMLCAWIVKYFLNQEFFLTKLFVVLK